MHWLDVESIYQNERSLELPSRLKSLDTGGKDHAENVPGSYRTPPFLLLVVFYSTTELDMMYFLREIFPL